MRPRIALSNLLAQLELPSLLMSKRGRNDGDADGVDHMTCAFMVSYQDQ